MFTLWLVFACAHAPTLGGQPLPKTIDYTRETWLGEIALPQSQLHEQWDAPVEQPDGPRVIVTTSEFVDGAPPKVISRVQHGWTRRGYGYHATIDDSGKLERWTPPQIVWPRRAKVGMRWSDEHQKGDERSVRSCEIVASDYCEGGLVSVCESRREGRVTVLRDHLCPGVGWGGFEALAQLPDGTTLRMWSEQLVRDGEPVIITPPE